MNFWILAVALLAISAAIISWPFFTGSTKDRMLGIWVLVMMPLAGLLLYQQIGNPEGINQPIPAPQPQASTQQAHDAQQPQMEEMVANLQQRMNENPDDPDGWIILGRSLKTMQRFDEAEQALSNANRLLPDNAMVMVELAETRMFVSGRPEVSSDIQALLESAVEIDPQQQKGLWLLGMAAAQDGDEEKAIATWQRLLGLLDPASSPAQNVQQQIEMASARMGAPAPDPAVSKPAVAGVNIPVSLIMDNAIVQSLPPSAVLYIFIHPTDGVGMPVAVKRIASPVFPISLILSDADTLRPGTSLADFDTVDISARVSMSGVANATSGDYQAKRVTLDTKTPTEIALNLDQGVP